MGPDTPLPYSAEFASADEYVQSLLEFTTSSWLLQTLCGGVHILDFYTREPDLYSTILPESWRLWFKGRDIMDILDLLMREDLTQFDSPGGDGEPSWRGAPFPPDDLLQYIRDVRKHLLSREFPPPNSGLGPQETNIARPIAVGMKVKKAHEVYNFARYIDRLTTDIAASGKKEITHLVDFGSGQNYLGRALAAPPYSKHIVAVESKQQNIEGAKYMDVLAKLVEKPLIMRNKKDYRASLGVGRRGRKLKPDANGNSSASSKTAPESQKSNAVHCGEDGCHPPVSQGVSNGIQRNGQESIENQSLSPSVTDSSLSVQNVANKSPKLPTTDKVEPEENTAAVTTQLQIYTEGHGSVQYVEHIIQGGDLQPVLNHVLDSSQIKEDEAQSTSKLVDEESDLAAVPKPAEVNAMVMSLHSCGNLVHHGLRSLLVNPQVSAVAMIGCCYNLMTGRLGPPTYKLPTLRPNHPRLVSTWNAFDRHGFPMSEKLATYDLPYEPLDSLDEPEGTSSPPKGVRFNITARMMAVQAPFNWGKSDSGFFLTRHFYRALLQRIFLDRGVVTKPRGSDGSTSAAGHTSQVNLPSSDERGPGLSSSGSGGTAITIGTLRKFAYKDFVSYVRAAVGKLTEANSFSEIDPEFIREKMEGLTDEEIRDYEEKYAEKKIELSIMWSLMAFSAGVVEAVIVADRWLWLKEQEEVESAWVEPVFEYKWSPRNLVVVGIKK